MGSLQQISRREFLKSTGTLAASGLFFQVGFLFSKNTFADDYKAIGEFIPNVWVGISSDDVVRIVCHRSEMGQGVLTTMPMLVAEELQVSLEKIKVIQGDGDARYGDQNTDGSSSARLNWEVLRVAGASAREMLVAAAAKRWGVDPKACRVKDGRVTCGKRAFTYGELAVDAAKEKVPEKPKLKAKRHFEIVGKRRNALNIKEVLSGRAKFGIDTEIPDMLFASIERSPTLRGKIDDYDAKAAKAVAGVVEVVKVKAIGPDVNCVNGVAVLATNTWAANQGREALKATWKTSGALENTPEFTKKLTESLDGKMTARRSEGNAIEALKTAKNKFSATYHTPYLVHAPMEPLNATAWVTKGSCEVWAPVQDPQRIQRTVATFLEIKPENVQIHVTLLGGGFGRKSQPDFVLEAVQLSQATKKPVKVTWTREDEIKHGFYHAQAAQTIDAAYGSKGELSAWRHRASFPTILTVFDPSANVPADWELGMGCTDMPYRSPNVLCEGASIPAGVNIGWMRSVCNIQHAFAVNSFVDELAHHLKKDPIAYRLELLGEPRVVPALSKTWSKPGYENDTGRMASLIKKVKAMSGWSRKRPKGRGIGFANHYSFFCFVATAVEAEVKNGEVKVTNVYCAVDPGAVVNPDTVLAQIEGGIIFGLSLALNGKITLKDGVVEQGNFDDYPVLRMNEVPKIKIELVTDDKSLPAGIGEPGVPPLAPALAGAIFAATGKRLRSLPLVEALSQN